MLAYTTAYGVTSMQSRQIYSSTCICYYVLIKEIKNKMHLKSRNDAYCTTVHCNNDAAHGLQYNTATGFLLLIYLI